MTKPTSSNSPQYIFGSMRAADTNRKRMGTSRKPSKLPTTLEEMEAKVSKWFEEEGSQKEGNGG